MPKRSSKSTTTTPNTLLLEVAWEVCNQVGGIYTVIRSKAPAIMENWAGRYCMIGPYVNKTFKPNWNHWKMQHNMPDHEKGGMFVVERGKCTFDWSAK